MNIVLFDKSEISKPLSLSDDRAKHILNILHKKPGDSFDAGIIDGMAGIATINSIDNQITFDFSPKTDGKPLYPLTMLIGFPRPIQLKRLFRDMAGLGVCTIHLMGTELTEKSYLQSNIVERGTAHTLLLDGTIQAKSTHVPQLIVHNSVKDCLTYIDNEEKNCSNKDVSISSKIALDNIRPKSSLTEHLANMSESCKNIYAAIGSERGWTDAERDLLENNGFTLCEMGKRVLRTETAATVAASLILSNMGVL